MLALVKQRRMSVTCLDSVLAHLFGPSAGNACTNIHAFECTSPEPAPWCYTDTPSTWDFCFQDCASLGKKTQSHLMEILVRNEILRGHLSSLHGSLGEHRASLGGRRGHGRVQRWGSRSQRPPLHLHSHRRLQPASRFCDPLPGSADERPNFDLQTKSNGANSFFRVSLIGCTIAVGFLCPQYVGRWGHIAGSLEEGPAVAQCVPGAADLSTINYTCTAAGSFSPPPDFQTLCQPRSIPTSCDPDPVSIGSSCRERHCVRLRQQGGRLRPIRQPGLRG